VNKISGILPSSPRIESVDMKNERLLCPGSVSFGQPISKSTERASAVQTETIANISAEEASRELKIPGRKSDENIAEEISSSFFMKNQEREPKQGLDIYA
jgi:hypothetical protein